VSQVAGRLFCPPFTTSKIWIRQCSEQKSVAPPTQQPSRYLPWLEAI
jgi:hypothetical protein